MRLLRSLFLVSTALCCPLAHACTVCDSRGGHQLRAGLLNGQFLHTVLLVTAPVPVLAALVLLLHRGMPDLAEREQMESSEKAAPARTIALEFIA